MKIKKTIFNNFKQIYTIQSIYKKNGDLKYVITFSIIYNLDSNRIEYYSANYSDMYCRFIRELRNDLIPNKYRYIFEELIKHINDNYDVYNINDLFI